MKKKTFALLAAAVLGLGTVASGAEIVSAEDLTTVRVAIMTNGSSHWYAVIGDKEGIFAKHGIQVEIQEFAAGVNTVDAVVMGQADFGNLADYAAVNRIGNTKEDTNLVIVDRLSTSEGSVDGGLYVSDDIKSVEDLAGQPIATQPGTVWDFWNAKTFEYADIPEDEQNIVEVDSGATAVALQTTGEVKAQWASGTNASKLEEAGFGILITLEDLGLYTDAYFISTSDYFDANPELAKQWIEAQQEIGEWIQDNPEQAAEDFEEVTGQKKEQFLSDLEATRLVTDFTQGTLDHLNEIKDWAVEKGRFDDFDILEYADLDALKEVYPDSVTVE